ncbi:MAG: hypothetical protein ABI551_19360 [Polyangiaceae bacterium]
MNEHAAGADDEADDDPEAFVALFWLYLVHPAEPDDSRLEALASFLVDAPDDTLTNLATYMAGSRRALRGASSSNGASYP